MFGVLRLRRSCAPAFLRVSYAEYVVSRAVHPNWTNATNAPTFASNGRGTRSFTPLPLSIGRRSHTRSAPRGSHKLAARETRYSVVKVQWAEHTPHCLPCQRPILLTPRGIHALTSLGESLQSRILHLTRCHKTDLFILTCFRLVLGKKKRPSFEGR